MTSFDSEQQIQPKYSVFEKHGQTMIGAILLALLLWTGSSLLDVRDRLGRIEVYQISANQHDVVLDSTVNELKERVRNLELDAASNGTRKVRP